jgi:hypothetical protein
MTRGALLTESVLRPQGGTIMRNLLAFMMALLLVVAAVGWYLDWFKVKATPAGDGHTAIHIDWNSLRFHQSMSSWTAKLAEIADKKAKDEESKVEADKKATPEAAKTPAKDPQTKTGPALE